MNSRCPKHDCEHEKQDVGRGKWVPVCPKCDQERKAALAKAFWSVGVPETDEPVKVALPVPLLGELRDLADKRNLPLNDYIVEKLRAIVQLNQIKGPED